MPNLLFYDNQIESKYKRPKNFKPIIHEEKPLLFIDCYTKETLVGTSYQNEEEAEIVKKVVSYLIKNLGYKKEIFGFVSPYQSQIQMLKMKL